MRNQSKPFIGFIAATAALLAAAAFTGAQTNIVASRITQAIDPANLTVLRGNTHPFAQARFDRGAAPASLPMQRMLLVLKRSAQQENALDTLLEQQQDASSPNYHQWLTPQQFGQQFGPSDQDIQTIASWLQSQGFQVDRVSNGRTVIEFSGTAGEVQAAFHTAIHQYQVNGENHWANSSDPEIPTALTPVVAGIDSLYNFPRHAMHHAVRVFLEPRQGQPVVAPTPEYTFTCGTTQTGQPLPCYGIGPYDFATIYNVLPEWNATPAINGSGETIAIVGESDVNRSDIEAYQTFFGLPVKDPTVIVDGADPGIVPGDETESDLDLEVAGGLAPGATIDFVISQTTEASLGVDLSAQYIVDNDVAPVLSESYGICEYFLGTAGNQFYNQLWQQAAAQGITVIVASGDAGSAVCDGNTGSQGPAQLGLSVSGFESTPYNVSVGGTDFNDLNNPTAYWGSSSNTTTKESALGYIPEITWNNTCTNQEIFSILGTSNAEQTCNSPSVTQNPNNSFLLDPAGGSGGESNCTTSNYDPSTGSGTLSSCGGAYAKPSWQAALTPADSRRDVPDISMFASNGFNGSFYMICEADLPFQGFGPCGASELGGIGGTSAPTPAFAAIMALINQKTQSRWGNANYILYKLAGTSGDTCSSSSPSGGCIFYDIPSGSTIAMPCATGSTTDCVTKTAGDSVGVLSGYATASSYDRATGLGSVNVANLVNGWHAFPLSQSSTTLTLTPPSGGSLSNLTHGQTVTFSTAVSAVAPATGTPTGTVALVADTGTNGQEGVQSVTLNGSGVGSGTTNALPGGSYTVIANYPGDSTFGSSHSSETSVTVNPESSETKLSVVTFNPTTGAVANSNATSFTYGSPYVLRADVTNGTGADCFNASTGNADYGCPTGGVGLTDNGASLGAGTFALNSRGYTEYPPIQLTGGAHTLAGSYSGDNSYKSSSGTDAVAVTLAQTTTTMLSPGQNVIIGQLFTVQAQTQSNSDGAVPGGTFTVFDGSTQLNGTVTTNGYTNSSLDQVNLNGYIQTSVSGPSGAHTLSAHYSGDSNYASSQSAGISVNALYATTMSLTVNPNNVILGNSVTLTATLSTENPASNAALKPTGGITFSSDYGEVTGNVTTSVTQDSNGDWIEQATVTTTPQQPETVYASYNGDANYELASTGASVNVTIPDFSMSMGSTLTVAAGQTGTASITVTPMTNYTSTVKLSCPTAPFWGATCSVSPASVTLSNGVPATVTLSVATLAPSSNLTAISLPARFRRPTIIPPDRGRWWALSAAAAFASLLLFSVPGGRRSPFGAIAFAFIALLSFTVGCGGGASGTQGGGGGGGSGGGPVVSSTTITASAGKIPQNSSLTLGATVTSTGGFTGGVTFSSNCFFSQFANLVNGTVQIQTQPGSLAVGTCAYSAQYSGDFSHYPSTSGSVNIAVTGTGTAYISGATSTDFHSIQFNVALQ